MVAGMCASKVKICGITCLEDAREAIQAGADYLGFNFYPPSPRYIEPLRVAAILEALRHEGLEPVPSVAVFVNAPPESIRQALAGSTLKIVQLHGQEPPEAVAALEGFTRIKAVKVAGADWARGIERYGAEAYLAEAPHPTLAGGSGESYDYALVADPARRLRIFLAGGLAPDTVAEAVRIVHPYAVDVASGVESAPGRKDPVKLRAFCQAVKEASRGLA